MRGRQQRDGWAFFCPTREDFFFILICFPILLDWLGNSEINPPVVRAGRVSRVSTTRGWCRLDARFCLFVVVVVFSIACALREFVSSGKRCSAPFKSSA